MILYIGEDTKTLFEFIIEFGKVAWYKNQHTKFNSFCLQNNAIDEKAPVRSVPPHKSKL